MSVATSIAASVGIALASALRAVPRCRLAGARAGVFALPLLCTLLCAGAGFAQSITTDVGPMPAARDYWLLTEFDWGDEREVVDESVQIAPGFLCYKVHHRCQITRVSVDGEDVLARFDYQNGGLSGIAFVTPDLDQAQAELHLARVGKVLADYVRRFQGEPDIEVGAPVVADVTASVPTPIAYWKRPEMEIRVQAGRHGDAWYVGAFFTPPSAGAATQPAVKPAGKPAAAPAPRGAPTGGAR